MPLILIIENNIQFRDILATALMEAKYDVMRVSQTSQAMELLGGIAIDLILIDEGLPEDNTIQWIQELREQGYQGKLFLMSKKTSFKTNLETYTKLATKLEIDEIIDKSIKVTRIIDKITSLLGNNFKNKKSQSHSDKKVHTSNNDTHFSLSSSEKNQNNDDFLEITWKTDSLKFLKQTFNRAKLSTNELNDKLENLPFLDSNEETELDDTPPISFHAIPSNQKHSFPLQEKSDISNSFDTKTPSSPTSQLNKFEARLKSLKENYKTKLEEQLTTLKTNILYAQETLDSDSIQKILAMAHKIHGTAGSFGFVKISKIVGKIEKKLINIKISPPTSVPNDWKQLTTFINNALNEIDSEGSSKEEEQSISSKKETSSTPKSSKNPNQMINILLFAQKTHPLAETLSKFKIKKRIQVNTTKSTKNAFHFILNNHVDIAFLELPEVIMQVLKDSSTDSILKLPSLSNETINLAQEIRKTSKIPIVFFAKDIPLSYRVFASHIQNSYFLSLPAQADEVRQILLQYNNKPENKKLKVAILDDDQSLAEHFQLTLQNSGMSAKFITDPREILEHLEEYNPDVLLLDLNMPNFSGLEICKMLRATPRWQNLIILLITIKLNKKRRLDAYKAGVDDFLTKPVNDKELVTRIQTKWLRTQLCSSSNITLAI